MLSTICSISFVVLNVYGAVTSCAITANLFSSPERAASGAVAASTLVCGAISLIRFPIFDLLRRFS